MKKKDKIFTLIILLLGSAVFLFLLGYARNQEVLLQVTEAAAEEVSGADGTLTDYDFKPVDVTEDLVTIEGWAIVRGTDSLDVLPALYLVDEQGRYFRTTTRIIRRDDVTQAMDDGHNYNNSGFQAVFLPEELDRDASYTVVIRMEIGETIYTVETDLRLTLP